MARTGLRPSKRRKVDKEQERPGPDIKGAFELHDLLRFKQSAGPEVKAVQKNEDESDRALQLRVLKQYCDDQSSSTKDDVDFPNLLSTWSFAVQSNTETILSAVPAVLAQFFRTISSELDFREFGLSLCHSLLKREELRLIDRGLSAPKFKEFLISPCLRLLTEIVSFDGGALAGNVFSRRDIVLKRLDVHLDTLQSNREVPDRRRPTVRRNAQRLLLALLKYLDSDSKAELVSQGKILHLCLRNLTLDGGDIVRDLLNTFRRHLIDANLSKQTKTRFLNSGNLALLAGLYNFEPEEIEEEDDKQDGPPIREAVQKFLLHVCTSRDALVLPQTGWYPSGFDSHASRSTDDGSIDLGLDSPYHFDEYKTSVPVKNTNLSTFVQSLRPDKDTLQAELLLKIFEAAPELVADYFVKKPKLPTTTKDDAAWRGQFAFIFSLVNQPIPQHCGWHNGMPSVPPPLSIVVQSILPHPMDRPVITRFLKAGDEIMVMSAARLLTVALTKLDNVQSLFRNSLFSHDLWNQACEKLAELVSTQAPIYHELVTTLQRTPKEQFMVRGAVLECMAMYAKVLTPTTTVSKFDVGPVLTDVMNQLLMSDLSLEQQDGCISQLISLVDIAAVSSTIKWWHKANPEQLSPFANLIRVCISNVDLITNRSVTHILRAVLEKTGIIREAGRVFDAFMASFYKGDTSAVSHEVLLFVENCMIRISKQPVKYLDQLEAVQEEVSDDTRLSLLACCVAEQWPFVLGKSDMNAVNDLSSWIASLYTLLRAAGENASILRYLQQKIMSQTSEEFKECVVAAFLNQDKKHRRLPAALTAHSPQTDSSLMPPEFQRPAPSIDLSTVFMPPQSPASSLKSLTNWAKPDFESELAPPIATSRLARLIHCLSSPFEEIRLQAQQTLQTVIHALSGSSYLEKDQLSLLLGETCETARQHTLSASSAFSSLSRSQDRDAQKLRDLALPTIVTQLAIFLLTIISDPSDKMYSKANRFLMRSPSWNPVTRIIPYWVDQILLREPEYDEPFASEFEVNRFIDLLVSGLRTDQDMELYRKSGVFERLCSLYFSSALEAKGGAGMKRRILHVISNAIEVEGGPGADTLITRAGVKAWFDVVLARDGEESEMGRIVEALKVRLEERCTKDYIERWESERPIFKDEKERAVRD